MHEVAKAITSLADAPDGPQKTREGRRISASIDHLRKDVQRPLHAMVDITLATGPLKQFAPSSSSFGKSPAFAKENESMMSQVKSALGVLQDACVLKDTGLEKDFVEKLLADSQSIVQSNRAEEKVEQLECLQKANDECDALINMAPDPSESEKKFLTFMRSTGARMNSSMKKAIVILIAVMMLICYMLIYFILF